MKSGSQLAARAASWLPGGRALLRHAAGQFRLDAAPIFMLHRVLPDPRQCYHPEMVVSLATFEQFLPWLAGTYEVVPLEDLQLHLQTRRSRPACALTFDDGWLDTCVHAFPLLHRLGLPTTVFLPLQFIGSERRFWQERLYYFLRRLRATGDGRGTLRRVGKEFAWCPELGAENLQYSPLARLLLRRASAEAEEFVERLSEAAGPVLELAGRAFMNWDEVRVMQQAGIRFGSHTLEHTLLRCSAPDNSEAELGRSRAALGDLLDSEVTTLSYPWGGAGPFGRRQAQQAGYGLAVTVRPGLVHADSDPLLLPRIALSEAQLGGKGGGNGRWHPATVQVHLARARAARTETPQALGSNERLRLGFVVDNPQAWAQLPDSHRGGSELQLRRILEALDPHYFEIELYFLRQPPQGLPAQLAWPRFAAAPAGAGRLAVIIGMRQLLRERKPALVQAMFQDGLFLGIPAAWLAGVPARLCARRNAGHWRRWYHRWTLRAINRMATAWQVNSSSIAAMLARDEGVPASAIEILPNWIDLERFQPATEQQRQAARARLGLPAEAMVMVAVANYTPVKNQITLVEAAARICAELPFAAFVFVGEGPEELRLKARITELGLEGKVWLTGAVDDVEAYLAAADIGVLSSTSEGCSNAALEYMAAGLPTVLSDIPANRALTDLGLVPALDPAAWAAALRALAAEPNLRRMRGQANRERVLNYGSGAFAERVQAHYVRAAGRRVD